MALFHNGKAHCRKFPHIVDSKIPELPLTITAKASKAITAALNIMLWLPMKAIDAVQFALAPAEPVTFNTRKLRRKRKFFVRPELPSII